FGRLAESGNAGVLLGVVSSEVSSSPESQFQPRQLDKATENSWTASPETNGISSPSDIPQHEEKSRTRPDVSVTPSSSPPPVPSTSGASALRHQHSLLEPPSQPLLRRRRSSAGISGRCPDCGKKREDAISYTIEDLDAVGSAPLESSFTGLVCTCDQKTLPLPPDVSPHFKKPHPDLRKYRSVETSSSRWGSNYLSPDDALWDLKRQPEDNTEYRWELSTSRTDVDLNRRTKCSCHDLTPEEKRHPDRSDLRKHHSAETDKWSLRPDRLSPPHDLRKHSSDASGMARDGTQPTARTLQVPEVLPNPKPRCTCPKPKTLSPSPVNEKRAQRFQDQENRTLFSKSLTPTADESEAAVERPELKKHASEDTRQPVKKERGRLVQQKAVVGSIKKWEPKDPVVSPEDSRRAQRSRWAGMTHFSLQPEKKEIKYGDPKSKSLKEKQRYSVRRSLSPEPDPRTIVRVNSRIVKRLISPEITITDAKWAPYEGYSPLPSVGIKKREPKRISEIKWTPYDGSASELSILEVPEEAEANDEYHITPTCHPPPKAPDLKDEETDEERERWRFLNQISPFPIYQGAWKDESPEQSPQRIMTPEDFEPPIWKPMEPPSPVRARTPSPVYQEPVKPTKESKRKKLRGRAESTQSRKESMLVPPTVIVRAASEDPKRQRPILTRSNAFLELPRSRGIDPTKRSLSEEVPRSRSREAHRGPSRAKSEEASRYPWGDESEIRQYVTTV
ncbi:serine/arginine repetitive matrix protein 1-like, partial [Microplitis demolitor]|uniref:serine/arginine repetitive matrix protein 1-like n=1 Tax=Microplitis demolitor TaxID=69319 RepID=UPI00235B6F4E